MNIKEFTKAFGLENKILAVTRTDGKTPSRGKEVFPVRCTMSALQYALKGNEVVLTRQNSPCGGGLVGMGFRDGLPQTPGGFGKFISCGAGEGFPAGERLKSNETNGERMITSQPQNVLKGHECICLKPYEDNDNADTVIIFCTADQLSAMNFLFNYSKSGESYDTVIMPPTSGCSSLFRIPFGELEKAEPRAVIGLADINARVDYDKELLTFTVSGDDFHRMLSDADQSFVITPLWQRLFDRL